MKFKIKERSKKTLRKKGAPQGNKNALRHGAYRTVYFDDLSEDEINYLAELSYSIEEMLLHIIDNCTIREMHLMKLLKKYEDVEFSSNLGSGLFIANEVVKTTEILFDDPSEQVKYENIRQGRINEGKIRYLGQTEQITTVQSGAIYAIISLQHSLTSVLALKLKCIKQLCEYRQSTQTQDDNNSIVEDWINAIHLA